jgi:hypothetical protein
MHIAFALPLLLLATPALAQFPPPGVYDCAAENGDKLGVLSLLVAGDYQWDANGMTSKGQIASSGTAVEALGGPLGDQHWHGSFFTQMDRTTFSFETDAGLVVCQ